MKKNLSPPYIVVALLLLLHMYTPISQKNTLLPHYVSLSLFRKKNMFVFSMLPCRYYYTPAIWSRDKKNCIRKIWLMLPEYFFWTDPHYYKRCMLLFHDPVTT